MTFRRSVVALSSDRERTMKYIFFANTDPGLARGNNEDAVVLDEHYPIALLADGMGGYNAGEVASGMATTFIKSELVRWLAVSGQHANVSQIEAFLAACVKKANMSILNAAISNPQYAGMGTTLVAAVFHGDQLVLAHVGDSRCYRLRLGILAQLTKDHSVLQEKVDAGLMTRDEAAVAPGKNLLTRALGVEPGVQADVQTLAVKAGDLYLMCSDGLSDMLSDADLESLLQTGGDLSKMGQNLIDAANSRGGRDNISVLLVQAEKSPPAGLVARLFG